MAGSLLGDLRGLLARTEAARDRAAAGHSMSEYSRMPDTWRRVRWSSSASYSTTASAERKDGNHANRHGECLWMSPSCLNPEPTLFEAA